MTVPKIPVSFTQTRFVNQKLKIMSCCCEKIYKFCEKVPSCDQSVFKKMFIGLPDGSYTVVLDFLDSVIKIPITVAGDVVTLTDADALKLNEDFTYRGRVIDEDGETVNLTEDDVEYDCFEFSTYYGK